MTQNYIAPLPEIKFLLNNVFNIEELLKLCGQDIGADVVEAVLEQAALFAQNELNPINRVGDQVGAKFKDGKVQTPPGFKEAYKKFIENGWNSVPFAPEYGGQGLPWLVSVAIAEMWNGANMAFTLCPLLTQGAVESLHHHASDELKNKYLAKLISGQWTGTMCLTEPQAGSDLAAIRSSATPNGDHYLIKGQKIFITYGEHDYTDNIIHMVLARTPGAPEGVKGISLFVVPKFLEPLIPNDLKAISIEHKLGIHASPTCVMQFGEDKGAIGYLVGEENNGLKYMFTMMNNARLSVGVEGLGISENSYQQALAYAHERIQGKTVGLVESSLAPSPQPPAPISSHPDVTRMLLTIKAHTEACRAIIYYIARSMDIAKYHSDANTRQINQDIVDLLIPVAKAHATEHGFSNASIAMQVFGGLGYIEETGIAQNLRDARIAMIYEGTNGIQAMDLVFRKLTLNDGRLFESFIGQINSQGREVEMLKNATKKMQKLIKENPAEAGMQAANYLKNFGTILGGVLLSKQVEIIENFQLDAGFVKQKKETAEFYDRYVLEI